MIAPRLDPIPAVGAINDTWTATGYLFAATGADGEALIELEVFVGQYRLSLPQGGNPLSNGNFQLANAQTLQFILPAEVSSGQILPVRIFANGAETPPQWITVP